MGRGTGRPDFAVATEGHGTDRAKASKMEHAARHHISIHYREDPAHYRKLSERLEQILQTLEGRWYELLEALRGLTEEIRAGRPADDTGLDPRTQAPFLGILADRATAGKAGEGERLKQLAALTVEMVKLVRQSTCTVDFWKRVERVLPTWQPASSGSPRTAGPTSSDSETRVRSRGELCAESRRSPASGVGLSQQAVEPPARKNRRR